MMNGLRATVAVFSLVLLLSAWPQAQGTPPGTPLTLITREGRRPVPTTTLSGQELIALDDVASLFGVTVSEDTLTGGLTITYQGQTIIVSADQPMASVSGRIVTLPSPAMRVGDRWFVPVDFLSRALAPIYGTRIDLRRASRLLIVGDLRVPRVTARIEAVGPPTRATIEISPATPVSVTVEPDRVITRIEADALDLALPPEGAGLIDQIRPGDLPATVTAVLDPSAGPARAVPAEAGTVTRVAIEVATSAAPGDAAVPPPTAAAPSPALPPIFSTPRAVIQTIVIDPGHGGEDTGVIGPDGTEEKQITLAVARRLRALIETRLGIRVVMTREEDRAVTPDERSAVANNSKADLFVSLHLNGAPSPQVAGAEVFYLRLDREGEDARRTAETEAVSLPVLGGTMRTIDVIRWDLAQARHVEASASFGAMLEEDLRQRVPMGPRPLYDAPLRVLAGVNMPAALVEMAYLTNPSQEQVARSEAFQTSVAQSVYDAILRFRAYLEERQP